MDTRQREKRGLVLRQIWMLCPARHIILLASLVVVGLYFTLRGIRGLMIFLCEHVARPWHSFMSYAVSTLRFSVAELLYSLLAIIFLVYIIFTVIQLIRRPARLRRLYRTLVTVVCAGLLIYAGVCMLWGVCYYGESFEQKSGIEAKGVTAAELKTVTAYFASVANEYADAVPRDKDGLFDVGREEILDRAEGVYRNVSMLFPCLDGAERRPKPVTLSAVLSHMNFTGFFFAFTGEANLNMDSPACMLPATVAHELAHQRGVAMEQEANFVAVLASMESGDPVFRYSAALMAYIYLGNALYSADYDAWEELAESLEPGVRSDLKANDEYWRRYQTPISDASEAVYSGFLQSNGQELGMKSYGACVDLLVAYYSGTITNDY